MSLEVRNLSFAYGRHRVLQNVSFRARGGELLAVLGPNGVGKSTMFHLLLGLEKSRFGTLLIDGVPVDSSSALLAKQIAYVPPVPLSQLQLLRDGYGADGDDGTGAWIGITRGKADGAGHGRHGADGDSAS